MRSRRGAAAASQAAAPTFAMGARARGKTARLRLIAGLERPSAGAIRIDGEDLVGLSPSVRLLFKDARLLVWQRVLRDGSVALDIVLGAV